MVQDWEAMVLVGRVARPHGRCGHLVINPETDFIESRFKVGQAFYVKLENRIELFTINAVRFSSGRPIIGVSGVESINDAAVLVNAEFRIQQEMLTELPVSVYYRHDLVGCLVKTVTDENVGNVIGVEGSAGSARLVVEAADREVLVPLVDLICLNIDLISREIVIDPPEGLLDLNV